MRTMIVNGEEWVQSEDGMRYIRKEKTMTTQAKTKEEYIVERYKQFYPSRTARYEHEWESMIKPWSTPAAASADPLIDWTKPLKCNNSAVTEIEPQGRYLVGARYWQACVLTYKQGYTYWVLYDDYGHTAGNNAGTINVKNSVQVWGKSAWMVLDKYGNTLTTRRPTKESAQQWTREQYGAEKASTFQYIRYDYTEQR